MRWQTTRQSSRGAARRVTRLFLRRKPPLEMVERVREVARRAANGDVANHQRSAIVQGGVDRARFVAKRSEVESDAVFSEQGF